MNAAGIATRMTMTVEPAAMMSEVLSQLRKRSSPRIWA
jgi:hypothetical protein